MQRADKKHSENSKKNRKIQPAEIEDIAELIKYRLIEARIDTSSLKKLF